MNLKTKQSHAWIDMHYPMWLFVFCFCSLPLGSQIIEVPLNSSLSWHTNRLRDNSKDAYNVSYAWKLVGSPKDKVKRR